MSLSGLQSNRYALNLASERSRAIQSKAFKRSTKRVLQLPPLSSTSFQFSVIASNKCWEPLGFEILYDNLTVHLSCCYLFAHIKDL